MASNYLQISLSEAIPGMLLADDILDHQGQVLLPHGSVLSETLIKSLHRHEIVAITIRGPQASPEQQADTAAKYARRIDILFRHIPPDSISVSNELRRYVRTFRLGDDT
jgi:cytosine/adenosine deaminase-related metal-dependent hydrolase